MRFDFILAEKAFYPLAVLCRVLEVSRSGFYAWLRRGPSRRHHEDARLGVQIAAIHERSRRAYGSPRIARDLRVAGTRTSRKRVARLMRQRQIEARRKKRFKVTTDSTHGQPVAPNLLQRRFTAPRPNTAWVSDVKAIWTAEGWTYLAVVLDLFSRRVVGWRMSDSNDTALAMSALDAAVELRHPTAGLIHHSDRGSPYASSEYRAALSSIGALSSMSRRGDCWDNAVVESFFSTLSHELLSRTELMSVTHAERVVGDYIDNFYNLERRHSTLGFVSPIEFELRAASTVEAA